MSDFFARPPQAADPPAPRPPSPAWMGPPEGVLPGVVGLEMVLARNARAVVFVGRLAVYPTGLEFEVRVLTAGDELDPSLNGVYHRPGRPRGDNYEDMLRFGVAFSDGRKATNVAGPGPNHDEPDSPILMGRGGSGSSSEWRQAFWLWPLPPQGELSFVCDWPAAGLPLSQASIDAQAVLDAAGRAQTVFPGQESEGPGFSWSSSTHQLAEQERPPAS